MSVHSLPVGGGEPDREGLGVVIREDGEAISQRNPIIKGINKELKGKSHIN